MLSFDEYKNNKRISDLYKKEEEELAQILSGKYGIPYVDLSVRTIDTDGLRLIPEEISREAKIAIFDLVGKKIRIAVLSPNKKGVKEQIEDLEGKGYLVEQYMASTQSLERAWSRYKDISFSTESKAGSLDISNNEIEKFISEVRSVDDVRKMILGILKEKKAFKISKIVEIIVSGAIATEASDIHVEPEENDVRIRFRLDGVLVDITRLDLETFGLLLSRIKLLSGMKLNIKNNSQDGRFTVHLKNAEIEIRSSVLPGAYNESIVLRLLNPESIGVPLEELGIEPYLMEMFLKEVDKPNGMILNTGPTGSGKTTTLYAFLKRKKTPRIKIITIEDPIEYHLPGIVQTQVENKKGYDFANGLKSSLRQDPDVIMVGEIRDLETAETAVHAALTGHLVFSTLHTNNAAGAFTRLIDLGINPKILTSAINLSIAQRLVRRLCNSCKKEIELPPIKVEQIKKIYDEMPRKDIEWNPKFYEPAGCADCNGLGYKGRVGIFEAVISDKEIEDILQTNPSEREITVTANKQGILSMPQDGVVKLLRGITTLEELERVVDLEKGNVSKEGIVNDILSEIYIPKEKPISAPTDSEIKTEEEEIKIEKPKIKKEIKKNKPKKSFVPKPDIVIKKKTSKPEHIINEKISESKIINPIEKQLPEKKEVMGQKVEVKSELENEPDELIPTKIIDEERKAEKKIKKHYLEDEPDFFAKTLDTDVDERNKKISESWSEFEEDEDTLAL